MEGADHTADKESLNFQALLQKSKITLNGKKKKHNKTFYALNQLVEEILTVNDFDCFQLRVDSHPLKWSANFSLKGRIVSTWGSEGHRVSYYNYQ